MTWYPDGEASEPTPDFGGITIYRPSQPRNRWVRWARRSAATYFWAWEYGWHLATEHRFRFGTDHPDEAKLTALRNVPATLAPDRRWHPFPVPSPSLAVADVLAWHRDRYLLDEVTPDARWTHRSRPVFDLQLQLDLTEPRR